MILKFFFLGVEASNISGCILGSVIYIRFDLSKEAGKHQQGIFFKPQVFITPNPYNLTNRDKVSISKDTEYW